MLSMRTMSRRGMRTDWPAAWRRVMESGDSEPSNPVWESPSRVSTRKEMNPGLMAMLGSRMLPRRSSMLRWATPERSGPTRNPRSAQRWHWAQDSWKTVRPRAGSPEEGRRASHSSTIRLRLEYSSSLKNLPARAAIPGEEPRRRRRRCSRSRLSSPGVSWRLSRAATRGSWNGRRSRRSWRTEGRRVGPNDFQRATRREPAAGSR